MATSGNGPRIAAKRIRVTQVMDARGSTEIEAFAFVEARHGATIHTTFALLGAIWNLLAIASTIPASASPGPCGPVAAGACQMPPSARPIRGQSPPAECLLPVQTSTPPLSRAVLAYSHTVERVSAQRLQDVVARIGVDCHTTICQPFGPLTHTLVWRLSSDFRLPSMITSILTRPVTTTVVP